MTNIFKMIAFTMIAMFGYLVSYSQNVINKKNLVADKVPETIVLWPGGAPGETGNIGEEKNLTSPEDQKKENSVSRLTNVTRPTLTIYRPEKEKSNGAAVIVCPGGGYNILAWDLEGTEICAWLNSQGITAILLKYRVPRREGRPFYEAPLQDAQRALGLVRLNAAKWGLNPDKIGMMGFSAGGHLSAALSNNYTTRTYPLTDAADKINCRPDFALLIYPAYLVQEKSTELAPELPVDKNTSPTFLVQTEDDAIRVECSLFYYLALKKAGVPAEMHLYAEGGHGYGLRIKKGNIATWPKRAEEWLKLMIEN